MEEVNSLSPEKEINTLKTQSDDLSNKLDDVNTKIKEEFNPIKKKNLEVEAKQIRDDLHNIAVKGSALEKAVETPVNDMHKELDALYQRRNTLRDEAEKQDAILSFAKSAPDPLTGNDVKKAFNKLSTIEGEYGFDTTGETIEDEAKRTEPEAEHMLTKEEEAHVQRLIDEGELEPEELEEINTVNKELAEQKNYTKIIDGAADCLIRNLPK